MEFVGLKTKLRKAAGGGVGPHLTSPMLRVQYQKQPLVTECSALSFLIRIKIVWKKGRNNSDDESNDQDDDNSYNVEEDDGNESGHKCNGFNPQMI